MTPGVPSARRFGRRDRPKARQFLLLTNRFLVSLAEVGRIDTLAELASLENRLRPTLATTRALVGQSDMGTLRQGAERIVMRMEGLAFGDSSLTSLRAREIMTREVAARRLTGIAQAARGLEDTINRLLQGMETQTVAERAETAEKLDRSQSQLLVLGLMSGLGSLAVAFFYLGRGVLDRVARLSGAMRKIAGGDLTHPINTAGHDELSDMALSVFRAAMAGSTASPRTTC